MYEERRVADLERWMKRPHGWLKEPPASFFTDLDSFREVWNDVEIQPDDRLRAIYDWVDRLFEDEKGFIGRGRHRLKSRPEEVRVQPFQKL